MSDKKRDIKLVVVVSGGVIQGIFSSESGMDLEIIDYDNLAPIDIELEKAEFNKKVNELSQIL